MNTLMIDCSAGMNLVLMTNNDILKKLDSNQKKHTDELLFSVDELLSTAKIKIKDINNICVCIGPGSFTGIRVAISISKGLSIGTGAKVFTCSNFDIYSFQEISNSIYILDGFSDFVYVRIKSEENVSDSCEHLSDIIQKIKTNYINFNIFVQSDKLKEILTKNDINCELANNNMVELFKSLILKENYTEISSISPIYLRASQAEIERNQKLGKIK